MRIPVLIAAVLLAGCGGQEPATDEAAAPSAEETTAQETVAETPPVTVEEAYLTGQHCYFSQTDTETEGLDVMFLEDGSASGVHFGTVHDEANAYFATWETTLSGGEVGEASTVYFSAVTEVDGDTQTAETEWVITDASASEVGVEKSLPPAECEGLVERVWPPIE